jgi:hypothetical protein
VLTHLASSVPAEEASSLAAELLTLLQNFDVTATTVLLNLFMANLSSVSFTNVCAILSGK